MEAVAEDNIVAAFDQEAEIFEVYEPARGTWLEKLQEGIPFDNPEDGQLWLESILS